MLLVNRRLKGGNDPSDIQDNLDNATPTDGDLQNISLSLIKPLLDKAVAAMSGEPPEGIMSVLLSSYPDMDANQLQYTLAKAFLIADLAGQWEAQQGAWQMANPDIGFAVNLKPEEAIRYFESKGLKLTKGWNELWQAAHVNHCGACRQNGCAAGHSPALRDALARWHDRASIYGCANPKATSQGVVGQSH